MATSLSKPVVSEAYKAAQPFSPDYEYKLKENSNSSSGYSQTYRQDSTMLDAESSKTVVPMDYEMSTPASYSTSKQAASAGDIEMYGQVAAPIQGDPLLSESSVVIDVQKGIENARVDDSASTGILSSEDWTTTATKWE